MKAIFFKFQGVSGGFECVLVQLTAFDTDTFQREILYQNEGRLILYPVI